MGQELHSFGNAFNAIQLSLDNHLRLRAQVSRPRHPDKSIEAVLVLLESMGWAVEKAKGRSAHAWGFTRCPENATDRCRNGVFCQMQVWTTPRNP